VIPEIESGGWTVLSSREIFLLLLPLAWSLCRKEVEHILEFFDFFSSTSFSCIIDCPSRSLRALINGQHLRAIQIKAGIYWRMREHQKKKRRLIRQIPEPKKRRRGWNRRSYLLLDLFQQLITLLFSSLSLSSDPLIQQRKDDRSVGKERMVIPVWSFPAAKHNVEHCRGILEEVSRNVFLILHRSFFFPMDLCKK